MSVNRKLQQPQEHHQNLVRRARRQDPARQANFGDLRFRALLPETDWKKLPAAIQRRFTKRLAEGETVLYRGLVTRTSLSRTGWIVAQLCRLIGAPLPYTRNTKGAAVVAVTENQRAGGQLWTRLYTRDGKFPHVVHSAKRFCGPTGLEEYVGHGVGMALTIHVVRQALVFRSAHYFVEFFGGRFRLPRLLSPGRMEIVHSEEDGGQFCFTLALTHPWLGPLVHQVAYYEEV